jgi:hypothetical protein
MNDSLVPKWKIYFMHEILVDYYGNYFLSFKWVSCSAKNVQHLPTRDLKLASTGTLSNSLNAEIIQFSINESIVQ